MEQLIHNTVQSLVKSGLADTDQILVGGLDARLIWNRSTPSHWEATLTPLFEPLNIVSLIFGRPSAPYGEIIEYLSATRKGVLYPEDTETRTFLHDIEIVSTPTTPILIRALSKRKGVIVKGGYIAAQGAFSPLQAYLNYSSICFASLVAFLVEQLRAQRWGGISREAYSLLEQTISQMPRLPSPPFEMMTGPFDSEKSAQLAMIEAGKKTVDYRLVDSLFGNISYRVEDVLYISQTGSALDHLAGNIDPAPLFTPSTTVITASSELSAHMQIVKNDPVCAILHGHPPFSVAVSLDCEHLACPDKGRCHIACNMHRTAAGMPIIPGEVGTGPTGIATTLPPAISKNPGAIVYGHGVFTVGDTDFNLPFERLVSIEQQCKQLVIERCGLRG